MNMLDSRLFHFIKKEFIQLKRDRRMLFIALAAPVIQLIILGYVASTDIKHISTVIIDEDRSYYSRTYLRSFKNSGYFDFHYYVNDDREMTRLIDGNRARLGIHVPRDFGKKIVRGETAQVQAIIDGSNASSATVVQGYINQINFQNSQAILGEENKLELETRVWYNPEQKSVNFMVPAIFAQLLMIVSLILTTASIVKEKERGTMEMLAVTPLKPYELILGKLLPFSILAFADIALVFLVATLWFNVPMRGSVLLLFALGAVFLLTGLGMGLFISTISQTQRQAMLAIVLIMVPSVILSGFIFPIANMPLLIQLMTYFIPLRYFLEIVRGLFLKGIGLKYLWNNVWPLIVFGLTILTLSVLRFRKKIE